MASNVIFKSKKYIYFSPNPIPNEHSIIHGENTNQFIMLAGDNLRNPALNKKGYKTHVGEFSSNTLALKPLPPPIPALLFLLTKHNCEHLQGISIENTGRKKEGTQVL